MWFVGIDWGDTYHEVAALNEQGGSGGTLRVAHTAEGLQGLVRWLLDLSAQAPVAADGTSTPNPEHIACIVETSSGLLVTALLDAGFAVYPINPKTLGQRRNPAGAKTDQIDALLLARLGRSELADLRRLVPQSPLVEELRELTRDQDHLVHLQTRLVNQLTACLKAAYPVGLTVFSKLQQRATLLFLQRYPSLQEAQAATVEELVAFLRTIPYFPGALVVAQRIFTRLHAAQPMVSPVTARVKARLIQALVSQLLPLLEQLAAYDKEIMRLFTAHADAPVFASLPGTGKRLAPRLLAGWGDDKARFASAASMQGLAGTAPVTWQSGQYRVAHRRMACNKPLRQTLHQFAWHSTEKDAWAKDYYLRKRKEGKSHSVAVRALANQWVRVIHAMWRASAPYDPLILQAARAAHGRAAA